MLWFAKNRSKWAALAAALLPWFAQGRDSQTDPPRICVVAPLAVRAGTNAMLHIRGLRLADASSVTIGALSTPIKASIKEKKKADVPAGLDGKDVGDFLIVVDVTIPSDFVGTNVLVSVTTVEGTTQPRSIPVSTDRSIIEEQEPNDGFRDAQALALGQRLSGVIAKERDVDVFAISAHAQRTLVIEVLAARAGSLLDALVTLYDRKGQVIGSNDDSSDSRDPQLRVKVPTDGKYFIALQDAGDRGTLWHGYEIRAHEQP